MYLKPFTTALLITHVALYASADNEQKFFIRPAKVQKAVDDAFEKNRTTNGGWLFNGSDYYTLMGVDEAVLVNYLASLNNEHIYIMDVGCARAQWGKNLARMLRNKYRLVGSTFHIFSITGGHECKQKSCRKVMLFCINYVK